MNSKNDFSSGFFFLKFWPYVWLVFKSGLKWLAYGNIFFKNKHKNRKVFEVGVEIEIKVKKQCFFRPSTFNLDVLKDLSLKHLNFRVFWIREYISSPSKCQLDKLGLEHTLILEPYNSVKTSLLSGSLDKMFITNPPSISLQ